MITILVPAALRSETAGAARLAVDPPGEADPAGPGTLGDLLDAVAAGWPRLERRIRDEQGTLRRYVNVYVDGVDCRDAGVLATPVPDGAEVQILPSIAGGA